MGNDVAAMRGERILFRGLSLALAPGEAVILRGANGAGKTTLLRILAGLTQPAAGQVTRHGTWHWIGHRLGLKPEDTPRRHLAIWSRTWGSGQTDLDALIAAHGLARAADVPARLLSAGQRQRLALARLGLQERPVWLLDEPYTALDREGRAAMAERIGAHIRAGGGVVAAIHGDADVPGAREVSL